MADPLLVTISFSHFCWKARWALELAGIRYRESAHLPAFHIPAVRRAGGKRGTPTLVTDEGVLTDSSDILAWIDRVKPDLGLYGETAAERREIIDLEDLCDEKLGPHTRRWGYAQLLPDREMALQMFAEQAETPAWERAAMRVIFPAVRLLMTRALSISPEGGARSMRKVDAVFDTIAARLADGRRYLVGGALSAADLTFAALAAPAVMPDDPRPRLPRLSMLPPSMRGPVEAWRAHPAGAFALRVIGEHR